MRNGLVGRLLTLGILLALCACNKTGTSYDTTNPNSNASATSSSSGQSSATAGNSTSAPEASVAVPATSPVVISAGKTLTITVDQDVSTKNNNGGDRFEASLAEPVSVNGTEVLPRGTKVQGIVTQSEAAGHIKGGALLELTLDSVSFHGHNYLIKTNSYTEQGKSRGKRTAVGGGGGAALGAIVGAIAGGGKGAAIGAAAGAGAGTAGAAYTGDRDLTIPGETLLHFKLAKSVSIQR